MKKIIDLDKSDKIASLVDAKVGMCHTNVAKAFLLDNCLLSDRSDYVEGIWMSEGQAYLHAWIETDDSIIDPTYEVSPDRTKLGTTGHFVIKRYNAVEYLAVLRKEGFKIESSRKLSIKWDDPEVIELLHKIDPP
jgi:hypothetical protein